MDHAPGGPHFDISHHPALGGVQLVAHEGAGLPGWSFGFPPAADRFLGELCICYAHAPGSKPDSILLLDRDHNLALGSLAARIHI